MLERSNTSLDDESSPALLRRLAGAPISWGVCEVPGWGTMLPPAVVLAEMRSLGLAATELGPLGWLPGRPAALRELLDGYGLALVAGFVPLVLHAPGRASSSAEEARLAARLLAELGASVLVSAAVVSADWAPREELDAKGWEHLLAMLAVIDEIAAESGLAHALHPHVGTLVETAAEVERVANGSAVRWCLDTGHLAIGGVDPIALAAEPQRIGHVHLKDVDLRMAAEVRSGSVTLQEATRRGLFRPLGRGGVAVGDVVAALEDAGYAGWYVLEQDAVLSDDAADRGRRGRDVELSIEYLRALASGPQAQQGPKGNQEEVA